MLDLGKEYERMYRSLYQNLCAERNCPQAELNKLLATVRENEEEFVQTAMSNSGSEEVLGAY